MLRLGRRCTFNFHTEKLVVPLLSPREILDTCPWFINPVTAAFLAGKTEEEPQHGNAPESSHTKANLRWSQRHLPSDWTDADTIAVIGDISDTLPDPMDFIVASTTDFAFAGRNAGLMPHYRPARAGEFIQIMRWIWTNPDEGYRGFFYCYAGRKPGYAVLSDYKSRAGATIRFDAYVGTQVENGHINACADTHCFFVPDAT